MTPSQSDIEIRVIKHLSKSRKRLGRKRLHSLICRYLEKPRSPCSRTLLSLLPMDLDEKSLDRYRKIIFRKEYDDDVFVLFDRLNYFFEKGDFNSVKQSITENLSFFLEKRNLRIELLMRIIWGYLQANKIDEVEHYIEILVALDFKDGDIDCPPQKNFLDSFHGKNISQTLHEEYKLFLEKWLSVYDYQLYRIRIDK